MCFVMADAMIRSRTHHQRFRRWITGCLCLLVTAAACHTNAAAEPGPVGPIGPASAAEAVPGVFTRAGAIGWALQNNPELAAFRQQHGIAAAMVVIAKTYPFNPVWTNKLFAVSGPASSGIENRVAMEQRISIPLEIRGQGAYRRQAACAALSRTDWEILNQETLLAIRVVRAVDTALYQQAKLLLAEESLRLQEETAELVAKLFKGAALKSPDVMIAQSEVDSFNIALTTARSAQVKAENDLRVALGLTNEPVPIEGSLTAAPVPDDPQALLATALERRADLHARQEAVREAEGRLRLAIADRYGNPTLGPDFEYNETRDKFIGAELTVPLPVFNTHRGDILQRQAERTRAALDLRTVELTIEQQIHAALSRLSTARGLVDVYQNRYLPNLETSLKAMETLFRQGGVDFLKVVDIRRKLLQARSGYLDALYELRQARADLAAAVADPALALDPEPNEPGS